LTALARNVLAFKASVSADAVVDVSRELPAERHCLPLGYWVQTKLRGQDSLISAKRRFEQRAELLRSLSTAIGGDG